MTELNSRSFRALIADSKPTVVDFWATWCMPCKVFAPVFQEISEHMDKKAYFGKIDVDDERELAVEFNVESIPTIVIFKNGKEQERVIGVKKKEDIIAIIEKYV